VSIVVGAAVAIIGALVSQSASSSAPSFVGDPRADQRAAPNDAGGAVTEDDGALPGGVTVFDDGYPGVANLDPAVLQAVRDAARDAADVGIDLYINSGWRSADYQNALLREAQSRYGSEKEAARWVATAETSAHVAGNAVDIGNDDAMVWLSRHGARYGLCQIYRNEPWHYELRRDAIDVGCPRMFADSAQAPRLQP
jgi:zinc D-Ala-D-Ala carboxypeptidase